MIKRISIIASLALAALTVNAQTTFLDNLRKIESGKGKVVVMQSPEIDELVNGKTAAAVRQHPAQNGTTPVQSANGATPSGNQHPGPVTQPLAPPTHPAQSETSPNRTTPSASANDTEEETVVVDTRKKVMRNSYKTKGYRIQVFSGGNSRNDRQKAEQAGTAMKMHFPNEPVYVHFYSPSWKCRMGNYRDIAEARAILAKVKSAGYPNACIVKGTISVQY